MAHHIYANISNVKSKCGLPDSAKDQKFFVVLFSEPRRFAIFYGKQALIVAKPLV